MWTPGRTEDGVISKPEISIVIASCVGPPFITACLRSLEGQREAADLEVIVVDRAGGDVATGIERDFPWVTLYRRPEGESVPDLRRHGIERANGEYVAIIEEHCVARHDWITQIARRLQEEKARSKPAAAIGGVVADADYARLMDWAVYFTEYNSYMPPAESGETFDVCTANCVYHRELLLKYLPRSGSGYWEAGLNRALLAAGEHFQNEPEMVVHHTGPFGFAYYLGQRFLFSRAFAGIRRADVPFSRRLIYLVAAPLLIPLLWMRTALRVYRKGRRMDKFLLTLPLMIPITTIYVLGEWVGYLLGPGDALSRIE